MLPFHTIPPTACAVPVHGPKPAERGILFSGPMVEALLAGTKTRTRRALRPQPGTAPDAVTDTNARNPFGAPGDRLWVRERFVAFGHWQTYRNAARERTEWFFTGLTRQTGQFWRFGAADAHAARIAGAAPAWHRARRRSCRARPAASCSRSRKRRCTYVRTPARGRRSYANERICRRTDRI